MGNTTKREYFTFFYSAIIYKADDETVLKRTCGTVYMPTDDCEEAVKQIGSSICNTFCVTTGSIHIISLSLITKPD